MSTWIKWVKGLSRKKKTIQVAGLLGVDRHSAAGRLMDVWEWADENIADPDGNGDGVVPIAPGQMSPLIDELSGTPGLADAMLTVGWLRFDDDQTVFPDWGRNNGESTKKRLAEARKKEKQRARQTNETGQKSPAMSRSQRDTREGEGEVEDLSTIQPSDRSGNRPPEKESAGGMGTYDTSHVPWEAVVARASKVGMLVPPATKADRRAWFKYAVLSTGPLTEEWLIDAAQAVKAAPRSKGKPQAHFVATLKSKAAEHGIDTTTLLAMARGIEIPPHVWDQDHLTLRPLNWKPRK
jgi:hypothetical protein